MDSNISLFILWFIDFSKSIFKVYLMKVKYIDYGVGNRVEDIIYLNENLKKYPRLHDAILEHENNHTDDWSFDDFMLDLRNDEIKDVKGDYYRFLFSHPKAWANYSPILKLGDSWCFDITLIFFYAMFFALLFLLVVIG